MKSIWLASACALAIPAAAFAQDASPPAVAANVPSPAATAQNTAATADEASNSDEIIITATKRAQALSDVPIAVSAVTAEQLQNSGGSDIRQLNQLAPSLLVSSATNESSGVARIRGIGTVGENPGLESSVAVFIDGVYRSRTGVGLTELGELERIEVLRGPQGTLFGRNASAGLINIVTKSPSFEIGGAAELTYGNFDYIRAAGSITGPIVSDKVAARIDGVYVKRDGYVKEVVSGRDINDRDRFLVRGQLLIEPTEDLSIRLIGDYNQKNEECCAAAILTPVQNLRRDASGNVVASPNTIANIVAGLGGIYALPTNGDKYARQTSVTPGSGYDQRSRDMGVSGEVNWDLGALSLASITGYRVYKNANEQDADFNNLDILRRSDQDRKFETFTQELRLQGTIFNDRLDFLVGGYYAHEKLTVDDDLQYGNDYERYANCVLADTFSRATGQVLVNTADSSCFDRTRAAATATAVGGATGAQIRGLAGLAPLGAGGFNPAGGFRNVAAAIGFPTTGAFLNNTGVVRNLFEQTSRNYAFFTHNVISIVPDKLLLTLGARYTNEKKELDTAFQSNNNFCSALRATPLAGLAGFPCVINNQAGPGFSSSADGATKKEDEFTGTAVLSFKPVDELLVYGSYSRGYKAGGFNLDTSALDAPNAAVAAVTPINRPGNGRPEPADLQFEPEIVDAFEIGAKLDLRAFRLNAALFHQSFENFQLNTFNGINFEVANILSCKDDLNGADRDASAVTGACDAKRTKAGVTAKGVELEAVFFPHDDITVTAGITYADTKYKNNLTGVAGRPLAPTLFQLPGQRLSNSSQYVTTGSFAWTPDIGDTFSGLFYVDYRYQSGLNTGSDLDFEKYQQGFFVANARVGFYGPEKRFGIELWGQNILNTKYQQIAADDPLQGGGTFRQIQRGFAATANQVFITFPAEPRTYGITLRTKF